MRMRTTCFSARLRSFFLLVLLSDHCIVKGSSHRSRSFKENLDVMVEKYCSTPDWQLNARFQHPVTLRSVHSEDSSSRSSDCCCPRNGRFSGIDVRSCRRSSRRAVSARSEHPGEQTTQASTRDLDTRTEESSRAARSSEESSRAARSSAGRRPFLGKQGTDER